MSEMIGKVKLNLDYYKGEDLYCDGEEVEKQLLKIVMSRPKEEYSKAILETKEWPILYHLSDVRENIVEWIDISKQDTVLEIGAGCGAITGVLAKKAKKVTAVDLSKQRCLINAYRHQEDNLELIVGNFEDIVLEEKYDYITLIGVLEYGALYIKNKNPYVKFLNKINEYLKPNGKIIIAIENKYGMKYWAGCMEDHLSKYFAGLEGYRGTEKVKTFSKNELKAIIEKSGFKHYEFYYPYPDYKFPYTIYSDYRLPKKGELTAQYPNFDLPRITLFKEEYVLDSIIEDGLFDLYSNSYLIIISKDEE